MVRTSPWPTVLGTAALIALPVLAAAQTTGSTGAQTQQPTTQSDKAYPSTAGAATHHLTEAKQVLDSIPRSAVTGPNAAKMNQIRRHFAALQSAYSANPTARGGSASSTKARKGARASANWNTHLMALDRDLTALLGSSGSASSETATGTSGATGASGASPRGELDADVRSKLEEFRKHITEFAAAASGTSASGSMSASGSSSTTTEPTSTTPTEPATTSQTSSSATNPPATNPAQTGSATGETAQATQPGTAPAGTAQSDTNAARQHLTEARQSLADMTALPQAQQLQGEARNQVSQLISQFNQLITTQTEWRASYDQVNATLSTLLGTSSAASTSTSTQGAVGTSGSAGASGSITLDPAIRAKLEEFRTHLQAFYTAAGGEAAASGSTSATGSMSSTGSTTATGSTGAPGSTSSTMGATETSGAMSSTAAAGDVESHIAAIERILDQARSSAGASAGVSGSTSSTGSTGTTGSAGTGSAGMTGGVAGKASGSVTLTQEQIDQIRMHLQAIRSAAKK